jgi:hypothetical protein
MTSHLNDTIERTRLEVISAQAVVDDAKRRTTALEDADAGVDYVPLDEATARLTDLKLIARQSAAPTQDARLSHLHKTIDRATLEVAKALAAWDDAREHVLSLEDAIGATIDYGPVDDANVALVRAQARLTDLKLIAGEIQQGAETMDCLNPQGASSSGVPAGDQG